MRSKAHSDAVESLLAVAGMSSQINMQEVITRVVYGAASESEACDAAFRLMAHIQAEASLILSATESAAEMSRDEARGVLDAFDAAVKRSLEFAQIFQRYPSVQASIKSQYNTLTWAYVGILPCYTFENADGLKAKAESNTYIVRNTKTGLLKIGKSRDVYERVSALQTGAGCKIDILAVIPGDSERKLHAKFKKYRVHGEWFDDWDGLISSFAFRQVRCLH